MANEFVARNGIIALDDSIITGSLTITGIVKSTTTPLVSGSEQISYTGITDKPDLISGSSQINITETTGYSSFSSSIATTDLNQTNRINLLETSTGSLNTFTSSANVRLTSLESASGSIRTDFNTYTSSNNTTNTTQNSRLTSLEISTASLNTFSSSINAFSYSVATAVEFTGSNVTVKGNFLVKGSTTSINSTTLDIGDNIISLNGSGATNAGLVVRDVTAPNTVSGSLLWDSTNDTWVAGPLGSEQPIVLNNTFTGYTSTTNTRLTSIETSTGSLNTFTGSINTTIKNRLNAENVVSGSSQVIYSGLTGVPNGLVSGSSQIDHNATTNYVANQHIDHTTVSISPGNGLSGGGTIAATRTLTLDTGSSHFTNGVKTKMNSDGVISGSGQVVLTSVNGYAAFSSSIATTNLTQDGRLTSLESTTGSLNTFTSSAVLTSQTGSMTVLSSSFATTASFALSAGGVNAPIGTYNTLVVTTPSTTWNFQHNTGQQYPIFQVFNENGYVIIPSQIRTIDNDNAEIIFSSPQSGRVVASLGGGNGTTKEFTNSNLWVVDHDLGTDYPDVTVWDSNRNIIFPNQIESVNSNQIKIYFSSLVSGHVSVSRGGHILSGGAVQVSWDEVNSKPSGIVSGSSQILHNSTTDYITNEHIDHTTVSISAGSGLSGGGTIASTRTLTLDTGSAHFLDGVKKELNTEGVISGSGQVILTSVNGYSTFSSSLATTNATQDGRLNSIESTTGSLNSYTGSNITNINAIHTSTGSLNSFTSSATSRLNSLENKTGSYATTGSNIFQGTQTITGSLFITQDLIVGGSSSINFVSQSTLNIGTNLITVNAQNPSVRFGGLSVIDSGSNPQVSGSLLFDSINNQWLFIHQNQSTVTSSVLLMGPETYNNLGNETYLTQNRLPKGTGIEHLVNSNITDTGTKVSINSNTEITGTLVVTGTALVSGSSQVLEGTTIHSGSFFNGITVVSGSSQISHDSTTGYVANQHIDHTTVSISPGSGLSGGGTIAATRTLTLDTGSVHFLDGVKKELNTDGVISGSLQITGLGYATTGSNAFKNNQIVTGSLTVTGNGEFGGQAFSIIHNQGTVSTTTNIDWDLSNVRTITLGASVITLTFSNPKPGATYTLIIKQDGTGNRTIGWPTIRWPGGTPPTLTSVLNSVDVVTLIYDGSVYYGAYINDLK